MRKIFPGDKVSENYVDAPIHLVRSVEGDTIYTDIGQIGLSFAKLRARGPVGKAMDKAGAGNAREFDGTYTNRGFAHGDRVKVTGGDVKKGATGKIVMPGKGNHVVLHDDGSHGNYKDAHLSHVDQKGA